MKIVSIILASFSIDRLSKFLDSVRKTVSDYNNIEIIVAINYDNNILKEYIISQQYDLPIRYITTPYTYYESQHNYNALLGAGDQNTKFVHCISDRFRYITVGWDVLLAEKVNEDVGYYKVPNKHLLNDKRPHESFVDAWARTSAWSIFSREYLNKLGGFYHGYYCHDCSMDMIQYFIDRQNKKKPGIRLLPSTYTLSSSTQIIGELGNNDQYTSHLIIPTQYPVKNLDIEWEVDESSSHGASIEKNVHFRSLRSNKYVVKHLFTRETMQDMANIATRLTGISQKIGFFEALREKLRKRKCGHGAVEFVRIFDFPLRYIPGFYRIACSNVSLARVIIKCLCLFAGLRKPKKFDREMLEDPEFKKVWLDGRWKKIN